MIRTVLPGRFSPLGATFDGHGVNFALFSENATRVELCLFDENGIEERVNMPDRTAHVWHAFVPDLEPGSRYGFRVHGPWAPERGHRFNPAKLLVDPYAKLLYGKIDHRQPLVGDDRWGKLDKRDSALGVPKSVVVGRLPALVHPRPRVPWTDTVIYEMHVKGFTKRMANVPPRLRGTYLGLAHEAALDHLSHLGVTSVELLPIHECADEPSIAARGRTNYWGYSTLGFFAPDTRFAADPDRAVEEFREMVDALHSRGIEVLLDVVYNHTCEGGKDGPTVSLRGIDNSAYYRLSPKDLREYEDFTGCGNSLNVEHPQTLKLIMDSLRHWITDMGVDGFRFDLASTLAREGVGVDRLASFFDIIHQDPILSETKLVAEPWDIGDGGYQVGNFPVLWTEWNGRYRDAVRLFWTGDASRVSEMGYRLTGSSDLYQAGGRQPQASINFVTAHDGFTLRDLVTYEKKRNEANGEQNRDGWNDNLAWNSGVEGESFEPQIVALRIRRMKGMLATLLLSHGVPMITSGDEVGKTQGGNNNAYAQDNDVSWVDWELAPWQEELLAFAHAVIRLRREHPVFRRPRFFTGALVGESLEKDIVWFHSRGTEMKETDWSNPIAACIGLLLAGDALGWRDDHGHRIVDDTFFIALSATRTSTAFTLPSGEWGTEWEVVLDGREPHTGPPERVLFGGGSNITLPAASVLVLKRRTPERGSWRPMPAVRPVNG